MAKEETKKASAKKAEPKKEVKKTTSKKTTPKKKETNKKSDAVSKTTKTPKKESKTTIVQEENNYGRTILSAILIILVFIGGFVAFQYKKNGSLLPKEKYVATKEEKKFKEEYETLNGTTRSNGIKNKEVSIMDDNNVKYISLKEAVDILDAGTGVIYFGYAACPWSRNAVPVLLDAMTSSELDTIYYVNLRPDDDTNKDLRDTYILNSKNKAKKSKDADQAYYDVLLALANELDDYVLTTDKGKKVNIGEKRLNTPTVVAVKDGVVVGFHEGTVENHKENADQVLPDLTKEQKKELLSTYSSLISKFLKSNCTEEGC